MSKYEKYVGGVIMALLVGAAVYFGVLSAIKQQPERATNIGSVNIASEYQSTTTDSGLTAGVYYITTDTATLGSITVVSTTVGVFTVYDADGSATSTDIGLMGSAAAGTYTFDKVMSKGIAIEVTAPFDGEYITTYR